MLSQKQRTDKIIASFNSSRERGLKKYQAKRLQQLKEKLKPTSTNKVSNTRSKLNAIYSMLCKELKPQHMICDCCRTNPATDIHHKKGRRGLLLIMSFYFKYVCNECHRKATTDSAWAKEIGLSMPINSATEYIFTQREVDLLEQRGVHMPAKYQIRG